MILAGALWRFLAPVDLRTAFQAARTGMSADDWAWLSPRWWLLLLPGGLGFLWLYWKQDVGGRTLALLGLAALVLKAVVVYPSEWIGHADDAAYAEMAQSILEGRGLGVDYVSFYFRPYESCFGRPEDHWPPGYSLLVAPSFLALGRTAFAAKLPNLVLGSLVLPLVGYGLGKRLARNAAVGLLVGLHLLLHSSLFYHSLICRADILFPLLVLAMVSGCLRGFDKPQAFLWMGAAGGLLHYAKGVGILLGPVCIVFFFLYRIFHRAQPTVSPPVRWLASRRLGMACLIGAAVAFLYHPLWCGPLFLPSFVLLFSLGRWYRQTRRPALSRDFLAGLALWILIILPYAIRNTAQFQHPFYSTQMHTAGYIGYDSWETGFYTIYWDREPPRFRDKLQDGKKFRAKTAEFLKTHAWWALFPPGETWGVMKKGEPPKVDLCPLGLPYWHAWQETSANGWTAKSIWIVGTIAWTTFLLSVGTVLLSAGVSMTGWVVRRIRAKGGGRPPAKRSIPSKSPATGLWPWRDGRLHLLWLAALSLILFLSVFWQPLDRLLLPVIAIAIIAGWWGLWQFLRVPLGILVRLTRKQDHRWVRRGATVLASGLLVGIGLPLLRGLAEPLGAQYLKQARSGAARNEGRDRIELGDWIRDHLPGSVTMSRIAWELHYYAQQPTIIPPNGSLEEIIATMKYYGVTHLVPTGGRPGLDPWLRGEIPGLELVYDKPPKLYAVHYDQLPEPLRTLPPLDEYLAERGAR